MVPFADAWGESEVMTVGRGVEDQAGFGRSSVAPLGWAGASSIDDGCSIGERSEEGGRETD